MRGQDWEPLPYPIIVDSGASMSTFPKDWCQHVKLWETQESQSGKGFYVANGQEIPNLGRRAVTLMTKEGAIRDMNFEVCNVTRALGSVSQMCRAQGVGQKMWLQEKDGIYLLDVRVAPEVKQASNHKGFARRGN